MSKVKRGTAGEYIVKAKALLAAFNVYSEDNQDSKTDFILEKDKLFYRVQAKIINPQNALPVRKLTHSKTKHTQSFYTKADVDYIAGVDLETFDVYMVPIAYVTHYRSEITVSALECYKNNFDLQEPYLGNSVSASPQVGETFGNGNTELAGESWASVETLRETPNVMCNYGEDKVHISSVSDISLARTMPWYGGETLTK